ncbi:MAG: single-stranded DNA-binding protein [Gammaproteobacteria bacterium]|nr:single-stranded DNA-binding protein [Gammaproteobacteria bacterium]
MGGVGVSGSINKVILIGRLGREPEIRYTQTGMAITTLSLATSSEWSDRQSGEKRQQTEWHQVVLMGRQAEIARDYLAKGRNVYIEGRLQTRKWQDKQGVERATTEIIANIMQLIDSKGAGEERGRPDNRSGNRTGGGANNRREESSETGAILTAEDWYEIRRDEAADTTPFEPLPPISPRPPSEIDFDKEPF